MPRRLALIALVLTFTSAHADNWPQWRGPGNHGISAEKNVPVEWSKSKNLRWKPPSKKRRRRYRLGRSSSSPSVAGRTIARTSIVTTPKTASALAHQTLRHRARRIIPPGGMAVPTSRPMATHLRPLRHRRPCRARRGRRAHVDSSCPGVRPLHAGVARPALWQPRCSCRSIMEPIVFAAVDPKTGQSLKADRRSVN